MESFPNSNCIDCYSNKVEFASINNGVLICEKCVNQHCKLGYNISFIRSIDTLGELENIYIQRGGNNRFYDIMKKFGLENEPINIKYQTVAAEWYRRLLYSEVNFEEPPQQISYQQGIRSCWPNEIQECEFEKTFTKQWNKINFENLCNNNNFIINLNNNQQNIKENDNIDKNNFYSLNNNYPVFDNLDAPYPILSNDFQNNNLQNINALSSDYNFFK